MANAGMILDALAAKMPLELAEDYDNVGLLAGSRKTEVTDVLCALDLNACVIDEALEVGAQLIVTHHPILFRGRKNLCLDDPEGAMLVKLAKSGLALIAMHTNFDSAENGVNDALAAKLGLSNVQTLESGVRMGRVPAQTLGAWTEHVEKTLGGAVRRYGEEDRVVEKIAVLGGSGGSYASIALAAGADVFLTGEISYHTAMDLYDRGLCALECGHAATELPAVPHMADILRNLEGMNLRVRTSRFVPFR